VDQRGAYDTLVVGAGSAGCALAARLPGRVLLLEAGPADVPAQLRAAASLAATAPTHPRNWAHPVELRPGVAATVPRGRGLGGSGAINGANWVWATPADARDWAQPGWSWPDLVDAYRRAETDLDHLPAPPGVQESHVPARTGQHRGFPEPGGWGHGGDGPVPVVRAAGALRHPATQRFLDAAARLGFPAEPDKNAGAAPGAGLVPWNAVDGVRVDPATAYLRDAPGVTVRGDAAVARVLFDGDRARGVELLDGTRVEAGEVVLAAGAVGTAQLLLLSGVGPADGLRAVGVPVRLDLPVGQGWSDHPAVYLPFADADPPAHPHAPGSQAGLDLDCGADPAGDGELLLFVRPFAPGGPLHVMCALQAPDSRGSLALTSPDPRERPLIRYGYLRTEHDRRRLRHLVRTAAELLRAGLGTRVAPGGDVLGTDRALDGWIGAGLTTAVHMSGTAAMGRVLDPQLRVLGCEGLRVADTSVLPAVPRRGTAATAVAVGERAAQLIGGRA
jgi:choline dehydrogenase-like flavoprotein